MIDIKFLRENPEVVKENIRKKFQESKLPMVDEVIALDAESRKVKQEADDLRASRNRISKEIGGLMGQIKKAEVAGNAAEAEAKKAEAEAKKAEVEASAKRLAELEELEPQLQEKITKIMMVIPNIIDPSVPVGKDDSENVEIEKFGEPKIPAFEVPYHADILDSISGLDKESAGRTSGNGFYYLMGDAARIHSAMISYARDFMIDKGFTYCIPPFMIRSSVVNGVMSFAEMEAMMYKIEGEDLYLIGTSEHSMIGKFKGQIVNEESLPITMTSYSPCFRKEVGSHGMEERGVYRVHQFEKQEMVVLCKPEDSMEWYNKMWAFTVEFFRSLDVPVRTLECCSGDLADLKVKSCDVEAWSPRQKKYFEVGSCSTLGDAQARRLGIRTKGEKGTYYVHTLNNTVLASPRALIAFLENNVNEDGSIHIPEALRPYMGGKEKILPKGSDIN
ncbi:MAG: serine--tRNA ligase [Bacteroidales bacterium]|nr:serine--tRNA ligase [Lachnoclostridium sp.]MCM1384393.1 serine--tRNA ligase [Lachnoclostridium sp.]MCM1465174.1 serine--tRNA ligase [Bacteroidales bacterium]